MYILHRNSPNAECILLLDLLTLRIRSVVCKLSNWEMDGWFGGQDTQGSKDLRSQGARVKENLPQPAVVVEQQKS